MIKTKTGIEIPEPQDTIHGIEDAVCVLLGIVKKLAIEVDRLSDEIEILKQKK